MYERMHTVNLLLRPVFDTVSLKQIRPIWVFVSQDTTAEPDSSRSGEPSLGRKVPWLQQKNGVEAESKKLKMREFHLVCLKQ